MGCCPCTGPGPCIGCYIWTNRNGSTNVLHATLRGTGPCTCFNNTPSVRLVWRDSQNTWRGIANIPPACQAHDTSLTIDFTCSGAIGGSPDLWTTQVGGQICATNGFVLSSPGNSCTPLNETVQWIASTAYCCGNGNNLKMICTVTL
jgi:hypothetical protein